MYQVKQSEYVLSAAWKSQWPDESLPEICLAGRSNVGKSSLINTLTNRRKLAHVSATPGKTRTLNFYEINHELRFVDVPGYGYAKVSMKIKESFGKMMEEYISSRPNLKGMVLIVDYRHPPTKDDVMMYEFVKYYHIPVIVVATKEDKLKRSELQKNKKIIKEKLGLQDEDRFIAFSSVKKLNVDAVWDAIWELLKENA
ncbi:putative GTP-binding protein EngB [Clostridiales bacterium CHKCI006]|uniref:Probable GTP-binding protein EngB n=1 Tax=Candidatus Fimiplasma intestinipullorum TaxID=2840825 RepID=A0A9D1KYQ4_9FIRM|nr:putative GTP-binding protein EngB [Clostridiales bacterium CHKCI006]HIU12763.1 YihA family ribosome biogenesis GTP-binding protein [Candidatus Fimiplasma intestinipullorum]